MLLKPKVLPNEIYRVKPMSWYVTNQSLHHGEEIKVISTTPNKTRFLRLFNNNVLVTDTKCVVHNVEPLT